MQTIHNLIILDESGSMSRIRDMAVSGANETLQTIRAAAKDHPELDQHVTFVAFNSRETRTILDDAPIGEAKDIAPEDYRPDCCTPLFDAMGFSINALIPKVGQGDAVLVTIITDGLENASREFDRELIKAYVEGLRQKGWVFTYIGANQDVEKVAMSISIRNHISWNADSQGTEVMFQRDSRSRSRFFNRMASAIRDKDDATAADAAIDFQESYFEEE
jgi:Mg-chelatase subunit ChlD